MKALTLWQPWASLIMVGAKPYEFRPKSYLRYLRDPEGRGHALRVGVRFFRPQGVDGMKATIESTSTVVEMRDHNGTPFSARVWQGLTEGGVEFTAYIAQTQVRRDANCSEFERDLRESPAPNASTLRAIELRFVI